MTHTLKSTNWTAIYTVKNAHEVTVKVSDPRGYIAPQTMTIYLARKHYRRNAAMIAGTYSPAKDYSQRAA